MADSGPVTSAERGQFQGFSIFNPTISLTGLQAIDGLVSTLSLVSLGHDGGDSVTSQPSPVILQSCALG